MTPDRQSISAPEIDDEDTNTPQSRLFLVEPGWRINIKTDSQRAFCYMMAPGQDFYHGLLDGEIFVQRGEQRFCLACAVRRGLVALRARQLPEISEVVPRDLEPIPFDVEAERKGQPFDLLYGER
jgi:hypothetical protein